VRFGECGLVVGVTVVTARDPAPGLDPRWSTPSFPARRPQRPGGLKAEGYDPGSRRGARSPRRRIMIDASFSRARRRKVPIPRGIAEEEGSPLDGLSAAAAANDDRAVSP